MGLAPFTWIVQSISLAPMTPHLPPTPQTYAELQRAFDHFNQRLFGGTIPPCLITFQREKRTYGYFSSERFVHRDGKTKTDEIAMNPSYFAVVPLMEVLQTLVHEMVHSWQFHFGTPSRKGYHNQEWASKMEAVGLMPSSTGQPGGAKTGEKMGDYTIEGSPFALACAELSTQPDFALTWLDRFPPEPPSQGRGRVSSPSGGVRTPTALPAALEGAVQLPTAHENRSNRVKQRCPSCGAQAWGKPTLKLLCGEEACGAVALEPVQEEG